MNLSAISSYVPRVASISSYVPRFRIASSDQMARNLTKIALPAIALAASAMMYQAQAVTYVECINNCDLHREAHELAKLICYTLCAIFSKG